MLNGIEAVSESGAVLSLPLGAITEGYSVQDIEGLDPVPANIVSSSFARLDGDQYQSSRREKRNQIIKLGLEPDYVTQSVAQLRQRLYGWFMPKREVLLRYYTDEIPVLEIMGRIETFNCPIFVREPVATISVINHDPDFYEPEEVTFNGLTTSGGVDTDLGYGGSVDTGFVLELAIDRTVTEFTVVVGNLGRFQSMPIIGSFVAGDLVVISTIPGDKYVRLIRGGTQSSILYALSPFAEWARFETGDNTIRVETGGAAIPYSVRYTNKHGGL